MDLNALARVDKVDTEDRQEGRYVVLFALVHCGMVAYVLR